MAMLKDFIIIGGGPAGLYGSQILRSFSQKDIMLISSEAYLPYSRCLLPEVLKGRKDEKSIGLKDQSWFSKNRISLLLDDKVIEIDTVKKSIRTDKGLEVNFIKLLIATGADPLVPNIKGINLDGVFCFRSLDDVRQIVQDLNSNTRVVILGGGFIGLKVAEAFIYRDNNVSIIEKLPRLLPRMLDEPAAQLLEDRLKQHKVNIFTGEGIVDVIEKEGRVSGVLTDTGRELKADIVIVSVGVKASTESLKGSNIQVDQGILVNDFMGTSEQDIFAAGDVAIARDFFSDKPAHNPIWPNATAQARIAALNMLGYPFKYEGGISRNAISVFGLPISAGGNPIGYQGCREIVIAHDQDKQIYRKLLLSPEEQLIGFINIGDLTDISRQFSSIRKNVPWTKIRSVYNTSGVFAQLRLRESFPSNHTMMFLASRKEWL